MKFFFSFFIDSNENLQDSKGFGNFQDNKYSDNKKKRIFITPRKIIHWKIIPNETKMRSVRKLK